MTDSRSEFSIGKWLRDFPERFRTAVAFLKDNAGSERPKAPPPAKAVKTGPKKAPLALSKKQRAMLSPLGLEAGPDGFLYLEKKIFSDRGVTIELAATASSAFDPADFANPEMKNADMARAWLTQERDDLAVKTKKSLLFADEALKRLVDAALSTDEQRWLGTTDAAMRQKYLAFPTTMLAPDAEAQAKRQLRELRAITGKARNDFLTKRVETLSKARFKGRTIYSRYIEAVPFLASRMELEFNVEKLLDDRELDRLVEEPDEKFPATLDAILTKSRASLLAKVDEQLKDLARRVKDLPHIELLTPDDIAATVAPYYGGLSRDLKKRRAKSALVAVEEKAREAKYHNDLAKLNERREAYADVASYYPVARKMKRELVLYVGPTNSGKTWRSLNALAEAESGVYLAPLRLLALEGQEELEKRGKATSFLTGEERDLKPDARFVSSTIEMLNLEAEVGAVVVDEVQLLADERRGWAWLAAVVGAPANKVIMTGSPDCVEIVKDLASYLGETLTIHECQRYTELRIADEPMRMRDVRRGMAIICFSRRDVLRIKNLIQENSEHKVAVVYGNLSPQVRREEARRFREGEADILVATDAIAMGLNLPVSEVLFYKTEKFNGEEMVPLTTSEVRQIGGRAGRFGFAQFGVVNALDAKSLAFIREALSGTPPMLEPPYYVAPGRNHVRIISDVLATTSLERILAFFDRAIEFSDERFARSNIDELSYLSTFVDERLPFLDVSERLTIASAPVAIRNETVVDWFLNRMLYCFKDPREEEEADPDHLDDLFTAARHFEHDAAKTLNELRDAEDYLKTLTIYAWLAFRYPEVFIRLDECEVRREAVSAFVERSLRSTQEKNCAACGVKLPADFAYKVCEDCHAKQKSGGGRDRNHSKRRRK